MIAGARMVQHDMPVMPDPTEHQRMAPRVSITAGSGNRRQSLLFGSSQPSQRGMQGAGGRRPSLFRDENESTRSLSSQGGKRPSRAARASRRISTVVLHVKDVFKKRNVKIDERKNHVRFIEQLDELEEDLIKLVWFTADEIDDMKHENEMTAAAFDAGHADVDARGLENKTEEGNWNAYKARKDVTNALLDEQDDQQAQRFAKLDWEKLRCVCVEISGRLQEEAWERARGDESAVQDYLASTKQEWSQLKEAIEKATLKEVRVDCSMEVEAAPSSPVPRKESFGRRVSLMRAGSKRKNSLTADSSEPSQSRARRVSVFGRKPASAASSNGNHGARPPPESSKRRGRFSVLSGKQALIDGPSDNTGSGRDDIPTTGSPGSDKGKRRINFFGGRGSLNKAQSQPNPMPLSPMDLDESDVDEDLDAIMEIEAAIPPPPVSSPGTPGRKARKASWFMKASARFENPSSSFTSAT